MCFVDWTADGYLPSRRVYFFFFLSSLLLSASNNSRSRDVYAVDSNAPPALERISVRRGAVDALARLIKNRATLRGARRGFITCIGEPRTQVRARHWPRFLTLRPLGRRRCNRHESPRGIVRRFSSVDHRTMSTPISFFCFLFRSRALRDQARALGNSDAIKRRRRIAENPLLKLFRRDKKEQNWYYADKKKIALDRRLGRGRSNTCLGGTAEENCWLNNFFFFSLFYQNIFEAQKYFGWPNRYLFERSHSNLSADWAATFFIGVS